MISRNKKSSRFQPDSRFPIWPDAHCNYCDADASKNSDDAYLYHLECPICYREGCDECMPAGRGCPCPECEEDGKE